MQIYHQNVTKIYYENTKPSTKNYYYFPSEARNAKCFICMLQFYFENHVNDFLKSSQKLLPWYARWGKNVKSEQMILEVRDISAFLDRMLHTEFRVL